MSGDLTQPFDFEPTGQNFQAVGSAYTVPPGKYVRAVAVMSGYAYGAISGAALSTSAITTSTTADSDSSEAVYWLTEGDTIEIQGTPANVVAAGPLSILNIVGTTTVRTLINGNVVAEIEVVGSAMGQEFGGALSGNVGGGFKGNIGVNIYDKVS